MDDVIIVGGGLIGCFLAHDLSKYEGRVRLIERRADVAEEVSAANSAIVHAGYDPEDGTLKATLNLRGAAMYPSICKALHVDYKRCGAFVLACGEEEEKLLEELYQRARTRNIEASYLTREQLLVEEKNVSMHVTKAMSVPETAIIYPWEVCYALMEESMQNGVMLTLGESVEEIQKVGDTYLVRTNKQEYQASVVINAAGLGAQKIMEMVEDTSLFTITPKRGQYYILQKRASDFVKHVLYPVPTKSGKGVLALPTTHGNILLGPTNEVQLDGDNSTTTLGLDSVRKKLSKTVQHVPYQEVIHSFSGLRPTGNNNDFFIEPSPKDENFIHCGCIDSPGLASAPAISEYIIEHFLNKTQTLVKKEVYQKIKKPIRVKDLTATQKQELICRNPRYAHIICRCEEISEQEVVDAIHRMHGAHTIKAIKKAVRPGMGKCQGGFCEIEVAKLLARELAIPLHEVKYDETSYFTVNKGEV